MDKFDSARVSQLLNIVEKVTTVAPGYSYLISEAMAELREINEGIRQEHERRKGQDPTPAQVGDKDSPPQPANPAGTVAKPTASKPIDKEIENETGRREE